LRYDLGMKNTIIYSAVVCLALACAPRVGKAASSFDDITDNFHSGAGTIEFRIKLLKDISRDPHNHALLLGNSYEKTECLEIEIIEGEIIARRHFHQCLLAVFSARHEFAVGEWHDLVFSWNQASTKFYIDGREIKRYGLVSSDDLPGFYPCIRLGHEENFVIKDFHVSGNSVIYEDTQDREYVKNSSCPHLNELLNETPQEKYRGIQLHHFPDQKSRDLIKSYIALLPEDFARAVQHVIFVDKKRASGRGEGGLADSQSMAIMLEEKYYSDPVVFFHEAAHLYDAKQSISIGVPDEKSEWAAISGVSCYYHGADMQGFAEDFLRDQEKNAFLAGQGGQCAFEDLAIWVGAVYEHYIKHTTFSDMLDPANAHYNAKVRRKLDFLLKKGFFSQEIYDKVTVKQ
jgi:hypothetical protein